MKSPERYFPLDARLGGGAFEVTELLGGSRDRGHYRGKATATGRAVLVAVAPPQKRPHGELLGELALPIEGVARLRYIGPFDPPTEEGDYVALVEEEPPGRPSSAAFTRPIQPPRAVALAIELAVIAEQAESIGRPLAGLRPELVYVDEAGLTAVAPRCEPFHSTATRPCYGIIRCFPAPYFPPEMFTNHEAPPSAAGDIFAIGAILCRWVTGEHPFEGEHDAQLFALAANRRRRWTGPPALGELVDRCLAPRREARPSARELRASLAALERLDPRVSR